ncbi:hypothetical protein FOA43_003084 [Brettanomyces nanus]|uniref:Vacuolar segregation protein 7 n=1 Tax=Eeniella nana TaxID=13502 RepID=A0A875S9J3_EENNA|nr:uncharacterized protein FOA43_003084 [Brettanomyces nanus]QPG75724.1 hypothetical protein FOA43_003084 [Brettanomyces nanus]
MIESEPIRPSLAPKGARDNNSKETDSKEESRTTKASFIKFPDNKNKAAASGLMTVVQEQADSYKVIHIMPPSDNNKVKEREQNREASTGDERDVVGSTISAGVQRPISRKSSSLGISNIDTEVENGGRIEEVKALSSRGASNSGITGGGASALLGVPGGLDGSGEFSIVGGVSDESVVANAVSADVNNRPAAPSETGHQVHGNTVDNPDSFLNHLRNKKSTLDAGISSSQKTTPNGSQADIAKQKRSSAATPSILNLRAAIGQSGNLNTVSSTNTVQSKGSTRAEFFAAKLHDAIKDDQKNNSDSEETFVYDTAPENSQEQNQINRDVTLVAERSSAQQQNDNQIDLPPSLNEDVYSKSENSSREMSHSKLPSLLAQRKLSANALGCTGNFIQGSSSVTAHTTDADDALDAYSRTSAASRLHRKTSRMDSLSVIANQPDATNAVTTGEPPHNELREITSRIFDSKGVPPRKYSGIDVGDFSFDEDDEDELNEMYGNRQNNANMNNNQLGTLGTIPSSMDYDSDLDDEYSLADPAKPSHGYGQYGTFNSLNRVYPNVVPTYDSKVDEPQDPLLLDSNHEYLPNKQGASKLLRKKKKNLYFNPHDFTSSRAKRLRQLRNFCYTIGLIFLLLSVGFIGGFILATSKELQSTKVTSIRDILISDEEFVFNIEIESFNPGVMPVSIYDVQLDVFAKTQYVVDAYTYTVKDAKKNKPKEKEKPYSTILLGSMKELDIPLRFQGGCFTRQKDSSLTEMKIMNPCSFDDDDKNGDGDNMRINKPEEPPSGSPPDIREPSRKWLNISRNPFDLIVRGVLNYQLPVSSSNKTVAISYSYSVEPDKLKI